MKLNIRAVLLTLCILAVMYPAHMLRMRIGVNVTRYAAAQIAVNHVGGGIAAQPELNWEVWRFVWLVAVRHDGTIHEVHVHSRTGVVIR